MFYRLSYYIVQLSFVRKNRLKEKKQNKKYRERERETTNQTQKLYTNTSEWVVRGVGHISERYRETGQTATEENSYMSLVSYGMWDTNQDS